MSSVAPSLHAHDLPHNPTFEAENALIIGGTYRIAGVDEAGRGPLAGPVTAAAVILDPNNIPEGLNDSKKLNEKKRLHLFSSLLETAEIGFCSLSPATIDHLNIRNASLLAMTRACFALQSVDYALFDGRDIPPNLPFAGAAMIKGDARSLSIAAASIIAKVTRDRMMKRMESFFPGYHFGQHKGYGTRQHIEKIKLLGPSPIHRLSFSPLRERYFALCGTVEKSPL